MNLVTWKKVYKQISSNLKTLDQSQQRLYLCQYRRHINAIEKFIKEDSWNKRERQLIKAIKN